MSDQPQIFHFQDKKYEIAKISQEAIIRINDMLRAQEELDQVVSVTKTLQARIQSLGSAISSMLPEPMAAEPPPAVEAKVTDSVGMDDDMSH